MSQYSHRTWTCPFYKWDEKMSVHCEGGDFKFPTEDAIKSYCKSYCASMGYKDCTISKMLHKHYEEE